MRSFLSAIVAKTPVPYAGRGVNLFGAPKEDGTREQMRAMGSVGTLFAIVNRTSNATAQTDWKLWRKSASGKDEDRVEVTRHRALDVWNKPNPFYTRQEFVESFQQHLDLTGEGWWIASYFGQMKSLGPAELWPVRPDRMAPVPHRTDFVAGYTYTDPDGHRIPLELDEVVQLRMPNPMDPYRGMGPVQSILVDLDSTTYSAQWNRNFFKNGAEPGGIIEVDKRMGDTEFNELRDRWNEQHRGVSNAHRVAILESGKWVDRKFSQRDMQFAELRSVSREVIREAFGYPKSMLGTVDDVNRANAEAGEVMFARWLIVPRLERIKQALNNDFLPLFGSTGHGLEFDYCSPVPEDREAEDRERDSRARAARELVTAGYHPDDVREAMGLPEMRFVGRQEAPREQAQDGPAPG